VAIAKLEEKRNKWDGRKILLLETTLDTTLRIHPKDFASDYSRYETLTMNELYTYLDELKMRGADNIEVYEIEKYMRYTSPFAALILTFIGLGVSARKARGGAGFQIALGFLLAFIYIIFFIFSRTSAEAGGMTPIIAIWIPNVIFTIIGMHHISNSAQMMPTCQGLSAPYIFWCSSGDLRQFLVC
jgi:lipopolysaccharide export system permease protein